MYHTGGCLSLRGEGEQELRRPQDTVGFTPHICKGMSLLVNPLRNPLAANLFSVKYYKNYFCTLK